MKRILVPVDGSAHALEALRAAIREASHGVERVDVVNVQPLFSRHIARWSAKHERDAWRAQRAAHALDPAMKLLRAAGIPAFAHALTGNAATEIAAAARRLGSHEIVVSSRRHDPWGRAFVSSLSARLLRHATVPVRIVPAGAPPLLERLGVPTGVGMGIAALLLLADE